MHELSLLALHQGLQSGQFSSLELTDYFLKRIQSHAHLNAFIHVDEDVARQQAIAADKQRQQGHTHLLLGIPMAHKDNFCTHKLPTTCGSKMLAHFQSPYQATIVEKLQEKGVVMLGKTNMDEFAMGSANDTSFFGGVKNPYHFDHVAGGSSGGSAAAVAAGLAAFTTASDTGGSIRQPAAFCGISGLKPTYGLMSRFGMVAYASSLDNPGPMARSAEDLAIILQAMAGYDEKDSTSIDTPLPNYVDALTKPHRKPRLGVPRCFMDEAVCAEIRGAINQAMQTYIDEGYEIVAIDLSLHALWVACYYVLVCAEASSNLARYDGIRYGHRASTPAADIKTLITASRDEGFGKEVKRRILTGTYVLSAGCKDAYYVKAQKIRRLIHEEFQRIFQNVDVLLGPTTPTPAFKANTKPHDPSERYLADMFTVGANLAGLPALSIPVGFTQKKLPIGMQLIGPAFSEDRLLSLAHHYQQCTNWHLMPPMLKETP